jgi:hypothetical protein
VAKSRVVLWIASTGQRSASNAASSDAASQRVVRGHRWGPNSALEVTARRTTASAWAEGVKNICRNSISANAA